MLYIKSILKRGIKGMILGVFINQLIFIMDGIFNEFNGITPFTVQCSQFFISCLVGFYCCACSVVFSIEKWSKLKQTIVHLFIMSIVYFPVAYYAQWMPKETIGKVIFCITYVTVYMVVWISYKVYWGKKIKDINKILCNNK